MNPAMLEQAPQPSPLQGRHMDLILLLIESP
jgi:hypothetical protein